MKTKEYRLGELAKFSNGINFDKEAYFGNGIRLITVSDFGNNFSPAYESLIEVSNEVVKEKDLISKNDILFVRSNGNKELVGRCMLIDNVDKPTTYSGFCIKCHFDNEEVTNPKYFTYYFKNQYFRKCISNASGGTNIQNLNQEILSKHKVQLPPLPSQQKIASILSAYDDLIQNYKKQIEALQSAASELYKEWFVRFRFLGYQTTKFENGIPEGWKYLKLSEFGYEVESGNRPAGGIDDSLEDGMPSLGAESIDKLGYFDYSNVKLVPREFYDKMKRGHGKDNDILLYKDGAYIGKVTLFRNGFPFKEYAVNEHVFLLRSNNKDYQNYLYFTLNMSQYFTQMQNLNRNAAQPGLARGDLDRIKILVPNEKVIEKFNKLINPMIDNIFSYSKQITNLTQQRDLLLPRLMSGKLEVDI